MGKTVSGLAVAAAVLGLFAASGAGAAGVGDVLGCRAIAVDAERLACYDAAAESLAAAPPPAPPPPAPLADAAEKERGFGLRMPGLGIFGRDKDKSETAVAAAPEPGAAAQSPQDTFGAERLETTKQEREEALEAIRVPIEEFAYNPYGRIIVFLSNGQVWRQLEGDGRKIRLRKGKSYVAVIERGLIGSYNLKVEGENVLIKVTRLR